MQHGLHVLLKYFGFMGIAKTISREPIRGSLLIFILANLVLFSPRSFGHPQESSQSNPNKDILVILASGLCAVGLFYLAKSPRNPIPNLQESAKERMTSPHPKSANSGTYEGASQNRKSDVVVVGAVPKDLRAFFADHPLSDVFKNQDPQLMSQNARMIGDALLKLAEHYTKQTSPEVISFKDRNRRIDPEFLLNALRDLAAASAIPDLPYEFSIQSSEHAPGEILSVMGTRSLKINLLTAISTVISQRLNPDDVNLERNDAENSKASLFDEATTEQLRLFWELSRTGMVSEELDRAILSIWETQIKIGDPLTLPPFFNFREFDRLDENETIVGKKRIGRIIIMDDAFKLEFKNGIPIYKSGPVTPKDLRLAISFELYISSSQ